MKLTERLVASLKPSKRDVFAWDDALPGFGVRVKTSGVKSYLIQYRNAERVSKRYTLGKVAELRLEKARRRAARLLSSVRDERAPADPATERRASQKAHRVRELCDRYLSDHAELHSKPSYLKQQQRMIETRIKPEFGSKPIRGVTTDDVESLHLSLRKTPYEANRVLSLLSAMFNKAEHWKLRDKGANPCRGITRYEEKRRDRLLTANEVTRIYAAMRKAETANIMQDSVLLAFRLLFATACRASEILGLRWDYIDKDNGLIVWPDSKTGSISKPMTKETATLLKRGRRVVGNPHVCVSADRTGPLSLYALEAAWRRLLKAAKVKHCGLHAIRHYVATAIANNPDIPIHVGMELTGHTTAKTYLGYLHLGDGQARKAAEKVSIQRLAIVKRSGGNVVPLRRRTK